MDTKELIARRVTLELRDRTLVNLGIGLPTMVARYVPQGILVVFRTENGILGFGEPQPEGMEDPNRRRRAVYISAPRRGELRQRDELRVDPRRASRRDSAGRTSG